MRRFLPAGALALLLAFAASAQEAAAPRVANPARPAEGTREVALKEAWRLGAGDGEIFGMVTSVFRDPAGNVCLLDNQANQLRVYSPQGKLVRTMGRKGEGPGETQFAAGACALPDGGYAVVQSFPGKLILFGADGTPAGTTVPQLAATEGQSFLVLTGAQAVGANLAVVCMNQILNQQTAKMRREHVLGVFDRGGVLLHRLFSASDEIDLSQGFKMTEGTTNRYQGRWTAGLDGAIYAAPALYGYEIHVFDPQGRESRVIAREYKTLTRSAEEKKQIEELYAGFMRNAPQVTFTVEDSHADIQDMKIGPDGNLWVLSSEGKYRAPAGSIGVYDVFDPDGRFLRRVDLRGEGDPKEDVVSLCGDRVVVVRNVLAAVRAFAAAGTAKHDSAAVAPAASEGEGYDDENFEVVEEGKPAPKAAAASDDAGVVIICYTI